MRRGSTRRILCEMRMDGWPTNGMDEATGIGYGGVQRGGV